MAPVSTETLEILLGIGIPLLLFVFIWWTFRDQYAALRAFRRGEKAEESLSEVLRARGEPAMGTITAVAQTGVYINEEPQVRVSLSIQRAGGQPPYNAEMTMVVQFIDIPNVQPGKTISVLIDPEHPACVGPMLKRERSATERPASAVTESSGKKAAKGAQYAVILKCELLEPGPDGRLPARLDLRLEPDDGEPYEAELTTVIRPDEKPKYAQGGKLLMVVDPENLENVTFRPVE